VSGTSEERGQSVTEGETSAPKGNVPARTKTLSGGHDPAEMARKGAEVRRENKRKREEGAEHDRLTVQARLAVASARHLSYADLTQLVTDLKRRAHGDGHVANQAAAQLLALAQAAVQGDDDEVHDIDPAKMSPEQRAVYRAALDAIIEEAESAREPDDAGGPPPP